MSGREGMKRVVAFKNLTKFTIVSDISQVIFNVFKKETATRGVAVVFACSFYLLGEKCLNCLYFGFKGFNFFLLLNILVNKFLNSLNR